MAPLGKIFLAASGKTYWPSWKNTSMFCIMQKKIFRRSTLSQDELTICYAMENVWESIRAARFDAAQLHCDSPHITLKS